MNTEIEKRNLNDNEFKQIVLPLLEYLNKNYHPHAVIIITPTTAQIFEGVKSIGECFDYVKD